MRYLIEGPTVAGMGSTRGCRGGCFVRILFLSLSIRLKSSSPYRAFVSVNIYINLREESQGHVFTSENRKTACVMKLFIIPRSKGASCMLDERKMRKYGHAKSREEKKRREASRMHWEHAKVFVSMPTNLVKRSFSVLLKMLGAKQMARFLGVIYIAKKIGMSL